MRGMRGRVRKQLRQETCLLPQDPESRSGLFTEVAQGLYNVLQAGASGTGHGSNKTRGMMDGGLNAG